MKVFRILIFSLILGAIFFLSVPHISAQESEPFDPLLEEVQGPVSSEAAAASRAAELERKVAEAKERDVTRVESDGQNEVLKLFAQRPITHPTITNFIAYAFQYSVRSGVPANTAVLILLLPVLATIVLFFRHVVGVPSLAMILPIALSITLVATGLATGLILLGAIILASTLARIILKKIRIIQLSKVALTVFLVAVFTLCTLAVSAQFGVLAVRQVSIFPVLLLILLSQNIVELQTDRSLSDILKISSITISLGILGYFILSSEVIRTFVLLYPEIILMLVPTNILIGRYFGLRFTEYIRFAPIRQ